MRVENIVAEVCGVEASQLSQNSGPKNVAEWDSLKHIEVIMMCESEFNISFSASELPLLTSITKIMEVIENK